MSIILNQNHMFEGIKNEPERHRVEFDAVSSSQHSLSEKNIQPIHAITTSYINPCTLPYGTTLQEVIGQINRPPPKLELLTIEEPLSPPRQNTPRWPDDLQRKPLARELAPGSITSRALPFEVVQNLLADPSHRTLFVLGIVICLVLILMNIVPLLALAFGIICAILLCLKPPERFTLVPLSP